MLFLSIILTSVVIVIANILSYFLDFTDNGFNKYISLFTTIVILFFMTTAINIGISILSSNNTCNQYNYSVSQKKAIKVGVIISIIASIIYLIHMFDIPYIRVIFVTPFQSIVGESLKNRRELLYLIISYWCVLFSWLTTTNVYLKSKTDGCILSTDSLLAFKRKTDAALNKKKVQKKIKMVTIKT